MRVSDFPADEQDEWWEFIAEQNREAVAEDERSDA